MLLHESRTTRPALVRPPNEPISRAPIRAVERPVMLMRWADLTYLHWPVPPETLAALLPGGLEPDVMGGRAWVGLVPFHMRDIRVPGTPGIPYVGTFPETNVRTYVVGPDGGRGVYFHSLDVTRLLPVAVAQVAYRLPYAWSKMSIRRHPDRISYRTRRRWPAPRGARSRVDIEIGGAVPPSETTELDDFLAGRWSLYADAPSGAIYRAHVEHPEWPLRRARVSRLRDELVAAAGYDEHLVERPPEHVRFSPGVDVRVGLPRRVG